MTPADAELDPAAGGAARMHGIDGEVTVDEVSSSYTTHIQKKKLIVNLRFGASTPAPSEHHLVAGQVAGLRKARSMRSKKVWAHRLLVRWWESASSTIRPSAIAWTITPAARVSRSARTNPRR